MGVHFRWYSGASDTVPTGPGPQRRRRFWRWLAACGLTLLIAAGGLYWQSAHGLRAMRADLQRLVDREVQALRGGQRDAFLALLDPRYGPWLRYHQECFWQEAAWYAARPGVRAYVESVSLAPDLAIARIRLRNERGAQTEPVDWYFRRLDGTWRHAPPDSSFWGTAFTIEAVHVALEVQEPDREAGARLAPELDIFWNRLARRYGLGSASPSPGERALTRPRRLALRILPFGSSGGLGTIASPHLALELWAPAERSARLEREARLAVARTLLAALLDRPQPTCQSRWLVESLALWHAGAWQPEWQATVERSLEDGSYQELLAALDRPEAAGTAAWQLPAVPAGEAVTIPLAYTLGEYLGSTYPPRQLRDLLRAADASDSLWDAFQTVLSLDAAGLQAAWAAYLQQHYAGG